MNAPQQPAPGWYQDPHGAGQRYWDGQQWTQHTQAAQPQAPAPQPAPSASTGSSRGALLAVLAGVVVLAAAAGILFATGVVGGGDDGGKSEKLSLSEFKAEYQPIDDSSRQLGTDIANTLNAAGSASSDTAYAAQLAPLVTRLKQLSSQLNALAPKAPDADLRAAVGKEDFEVGKFASDFDEVRSSVEQHRVSNAKYFTASVLRDIQSVKAAADAVRSKLGLPTSGSS